MGASRMSADMTDEKWYIRGLMLLNVKEKRPFLIDSQFVETHRETRDSQEERMKRGERTEVVGIIIWNANTGFGMINIQTHACKYSQPRIFLEDDLLSSV